MSNSCKFEDIKFHIPRQTTRYHVWTCKPLVCFRACLDQLLIAIRSLLIVCDHVRSKERLIAINRPIATPLGGTTVFWVSNVAAAAWPITNTAWGEWGEGGEWVSQLQQQHALCCVDRPPLIDSRTICCRSCHPLLGWVSVSHCSTLTDKFPEDDTASANTTAWKFAVSERVQNKIL